ncbi:MAG: aminotransferase class IV [Caulobacter sp.]|nr:aminotransferase class IV [Caulobacter sp.]
MIPFDDRGLLLGDGLFETILVKDGEAVLFDDHVARLQAGCVALGLPAPHGEDVRALCQDLDADMASGRWALRLTLTAGSGGRGLDRTAAPEPHMFATAAPSPKPEGAVALLTSDVRRNEGSPTSRLKSLAYLDNILARKIASPAEALMLNNRGEIACAAAANIFWVRGGRLFTPGLDCGVLDGVMRRQVMSLAEVEEVRAPRAMLEMAEAVFLTSSLIGVRKVVSLDGVNLRGHPLVEEIARSLAAVS